MKMFKFRIALIVAFISAAMIIIATDNLYAEDQAQATGNRMTPRESLEDSERSQGKQGSEAQKVKALSDILASDKGYTEKMTAIKSLGATHSQSAAYVLATNLMLVKSEVRKGPQMQAVIGMYPCALALVENGTNSLLPVIQYIRHTDNKNAIIVSAEVLKRICGTAGAMGLIENQLSVAIGNEETARLKAALKTLQQSSAGGSEKE